MLFVLVVLASAPRASLTFDERVVAQVSPGGAQALENCSTSGQGWIFLEGAVSFSCPDSSLDSIELSGPPPLTKELAAPLKRSRRAGAVLASIPLWRVRDAQDACRQKQATLPSVPLTATVRCADTAPVSVPFSVPLALRCVVREPSLGEKRAAALRASRTVTLFVGSPGKVKLEVPRAALRPAPASATVVELDAAGEVARRVLSVPMVEVDRSLAVEVTLDTSTERQTQLGLELMHEGTSVIRPLKEVVVVARPAATALDELFADGMAVLNRLTKVMKDPCTRPDEAVAWLRAQPEVTFAEHHAGSVSFNIGRQVFPVSCRDSK